MIGQISHKYLRHIGFPASYRLLIVHYTRHSSEISSVAATVGHQILVLLGKLGGACNGRRCSRIHLGNSSERPNARYYRGRVPAVGKFAGRRASSSRINVIAKFAHENVNIAAGLYDGREGLTVRAGATPAPKVAPHCERVGRGFYDPTRGGGVTRRGLINFSPRRGRAFKNATYV